MIYDCYEELSELAANELGIQVSHREVLLLMAKPTAIYLAGPKGAF